MNDYFPAVIGFYTEGVKLAVEGSPKLKQLIELERKHVRLILCNACLNYYNLKGQTKVGTVGGMNDILEAQWKASKVILI